MDWKKENIIPAFKNGKKEDPGKNKSVFLTLIAREVIEQMILELFPDI